MRLFKTTDENGSIMITGFDSVGGDQIDMKYRLDQGESYLDISYDEWESMENGEIDLELLSNV